MPQTLRIECTEKTLELINQGAAAQLVQSAYNKFGLQRAGRFNRYLVLNRSGEPKHILVVFETDHKATVMTYEEALTMPTLAQKCKEIWND